MKSVSTWSLVAKHVFVDRFHDYQISSEQDSLDIRVQLDLVERLDLQDPLIRRELLERLEHLVTRDRQGQLGHREIVELQVTRAAMVSDFIESQLNRSMASSHRYLVMNYGPSSLQSLSLNLKTE